jgi:adenylate cyclase class 2
MLEIEVKLPIGTVADVESRLRVLGAFRESARTLEDDTLYDFPDRRLTDAGALLRVRRRSDGTAVTYKGRADSDLHAKVREERETRVASLDGIVGILRGIGMAPIWRYQKYRTTFRLGRLHAVIDESPIGNFLELEGPQDEIDRWAGALGFAPKDYLTGTYRDLYEEWCAARGVPPADMTFPEARA